MGATMDAGRTVDAGRTTGGRLALDGGRTADARPAVDAGRAVPVDPYAEEVVPVLRGVTHLHAAWVALVAAAVLVALAPDATTRGCAVLYGAALTAMFGVSGLLHRGRWTPERRRALRRLDHSLIHVFVAACSTTIAVLVLDPPLRGVVLGLSWAGAVAGIVLSVAWISAPRQLTSAVYVLVAASALLGTDQLVRHLEVVPTVLLALGIVLYAAGAVVYATRRPNPDPLLFGYHEVFHVLVVAAATVHFVAIVGWIVPGGAPG